MQFFAALPLIAFGLFLIQIFRRTQCELRLVFLWAAVLWAVVAIFMVELLSLFHALTPGMVTAGWGFLIFTTSVSFMIPLRNSRPDFKFSFKQFSTIDGGVIFIIVTLLFIVATNAFYAAPNNWDSMTYHLPRVMHWIQNKSVEHYPTAILRQLYQPPGAEYLILHFQILSGSDQFSNLIQWFAYFGSALLLSLIAALLGAGVRGQVLTAFLAATIPMGILQGSSTQNDCVTGFWLVSFVYFLLSFHMSSSETHRDIMVPWGAGLTLGLGLLTKGSTYVFALPWLLWFIISGIHQNRKKMLCAVGIIVFVCLMVNGGFYSRNITLFGTPLSAGEENYGNTGNIVINTISNGIRNMALHFGTPFPAVNDNIKEGVEAVIRGLGGTDSDPGNTWGEFDIPAWSTNEDVAGNPLHLLLILGVLIGVFVLKPPVARTYGSLIIAAFILFCMFFKWQLFHSRLQLPLFLLSMPLAGVVLEKVKFKSLVWMLCLLFLVMSFPTLLINERRPLLGQKNVFNMSRLEQYFYYRRFMAIPYIFSVKFALSHSQKEVGLMLSADDWEYPLWVLLKSATANIEIYHVGVQNVSQSLAGASSRHPAVIISELADSPGEFNLNGQRYSKRQQLSFMSLYEN